MGTVFSFEVRTGPVTPAQVHGALNRARSVLHRTDAVFSTWRHSSPISRWRRGEATDDDMPPEVAEVLDLCAAARRDTRGWFDPWALPGGVDPTGLVKGWAIQRALEELRRAGVAAAMVNGGGDVAAFGRPEPPRPWRVGIRDPWDPHRLLAVVAAEAAVATSGTYERGAHLINPRSGRAETAYASATVTGPDLARADAYATALAVAGDEGLPMVADLAGYEAFVVRHDTTTGATPGLALLG